jgi:hypothetical protein
MSRLRKTFKASTKSQEIIFQAALGTGNGYNKLGKRLRLGFAC